MRIKVLLLFLIFLGFACFAQETKYSYLKGEFESLTPKQLPDSLVKTDLNGDTISVVLIKSDIDNLTFDGNVYGETVKKQYHNDRFEYIVNITDGSRNLKIRSSDYHETDVKFPSPIGQKELWEVQIIGFEVNEAEIAEIDNIDYSHRVIVKTDDFVDLYVDEERVLRPDSLRLEEGTHYITSKYLDNTYSQKVNIKKDGQEINAILGGSITIKSADDVDIIMDSESTEPKLAWLEGSAYGYSGLLGDYILTGTTKNLGFKSVRKRIKVSQRSHQTFRLDEMVPYLFIMYRGTNKQELGINFALCKDFGWFISGCADSKSSIQTPYGESQFYDTDIEGTRSESTRTTSMTFSTGPMIRLWHKLYLQVGAGYVKYLSTSQPKILTADYRYKSAVSANAELIFRFKMIAIGAGYVHQFVSDAYDPDIKTQFSFSLGLAI